MKRPICGKCKGYLTKQSELVPGNGRIDFLLCQLCGWRYYRPERGVPDSIGQSYRRRVAEEEFDSLQGGL
jgi:hypothetical protein